MSTSSSRPASVPRAPRPCAAFEKARCNGSALVRIVRLHGRLSQGRRVTTEILAAELEVSPRTIARDIDLMRDQLGAPVAWDAGTRSYQYTQSCDLLPLLRIDADEALALALAGRTFAAWHGSPLGRALTAALTKIAPIVGGSVSVPADSLSGVLSSPEDAPADVEHRHFATLLEAIHRRRELRLAYRKPRASQAERRLVHPLHVAYLDHRWVLIAHDVNRGACRNFLLARIDEVAPTGTLFERPADFDSAAYLRGSLGRFTGKDDYEVRIALDDTAAFYAREQPWHPTQTLAPLPDGRTELTLRLNNLVDVEKAVLRHGPQAEVLAPPELRQRVKEAHAAALERYEEGGGWGAEAMAAEERSTFDAG